MITDVINTIFEKYQVRKSKKQKTAFIEYIRSLCEENGISCVVEKKGMSRNIVMGASPEDSELVLTAHYDTCAVMPFPNFLTPKSMLIYLLYQVLLCVVMFAPGVLVAFILKWLGYSDFSYMGFAVLTFAVCYLMMFGPANRHTANDNTSGVITVLNTMLSMPAEQRSKVCFVLFDNEEIGLVGSSSFAAMHRKAMKSKVLFNFDCVSDGDYLLVKPQKKDKKTGLFNDIQAAYGAAAESSGMNLEINTKCFYPSDQANFKRGVAFAAFNKSKLCGLYVDKIHTPKDTVFNERNIECLTAGTLAYLGCDADAEKSSAE